MQPSGSTIYPMSWFSPARRARVKASRPPPAIAHSETSRPLFSRRADRHSSSTEPSSHCVSLLLFAALIAFGQTLGSAYDGGVSSSLTGVPTSGTQDRHDRPDDDDHDAPAKGHRKTKS